MKALITGAGGLIGGHLTSHLLNLGYQVRATDIKQFDSWWQTDDRAESVANVDLTKQNGDLFLLFHKWDVEWGMAYEPDIDVVFHLASQMGGIGYISDRNLSADIIHQNTLMDVNVIQSARDANVSKFFFSSSACVYPTHRMHEPVYVALREHDVYPAMCNESYGWQKLHTEHILREYGDWAYIARFQNTYGSYGDWTGGREKVPAAICRKVAQLKIRGKPCLEVWGDGEQTRSFMYVDDCVKAIEQLVNTDCHDPVTLGPNTITTINELIDVICDVADYHPRKMHDLSKPQGVRGRVFNHDKLMEVLGWVPETGLDEGIRELYGWVEGKVRESLK